MSAGAEWGDHGGKYMEAVRSWFKGVGGVLVVSCQQGRGRKCRWCPVADGHVSDVIASILCMSRAFDISNIGCLVSCTSPRNLSRL